MFLCSALTWLLCAAIQSISLRHSIHAVCESIRLKSSDLLAEPTVDDLGCIFCLQGIIPWAEAAFAYETISHFLN